MKNNQICIISLLILVSNLFIYISKLVNISSIIFLIFLGLGISITPFKKYLQIHENMLYNLGDIGLILFMFITGVESSDYFCKNRDNLKKTGIIASFGLFTPMIITFIGMKLLGFSNLISIITGICLSITAEAVNGKILMDNQLLNTNSGSILMGAGLIDDTIGILLFLGVLIYLGNQINYKEPIILISILILYFVGLKKQNEIKKNRNYTLLKNIVLNIFLPFFFISMVLRLSFDHKYINIKFIIILLIIAIVGKIGGVLLSKPFVNISFNKLLLIGFGMNSRGAIEIAIAMIALRNNVLPIQVYNSLILIVLITSLMFTITIKFVKKKEIKSSD